MSDFRLGAVAGFEIRIDFSWFIIFFLILWTFSFGVFPAQYPQLSQGVHLAMGVTGTLLFFVSLLVHELSHSVVARAKGIPVEGITLFIFGGMAKTRMEAEQPGDEFQIAGVGPLTSLLIAGLLLGVWWVGAAAGWSAAVRGVALYLGQLNILLAVFNLLPGFPLDGGRLFRAIVWKLSGDLEKATRWATTGGKALGYGLVGLGLLQVFQGNVVGGLWFVFIGWFLKNAAEHSYKQQLASWLLAGADAQDVMTRFPETVPPEITLAELVEERFLRRRFHAYPVAADDAPVGLITLQQVKDVPREAWGGRTVADTMTPLDAGIAVAPETPLRDVLERMQDAGHRRLLVVRQGRLMGIVSGSDVAEWLSRARAMRDVGRPARVRGARPGDAGTGGAA